MADGMLSREEFDRLFRYDSATGQIYRNPKASFRTQDGSPFGSKDTYGYLQGRVYGKLRLLHRVIYERFIGPIPDGFTVDHINGVRHDNRIENLRSVSHRVNCQNKRMPAGNNRTGVIGVGWRETHKVYRAQAMCPKTRKQIHLGNFDNIIDAYAARLRYVRTHYEGCTV